MNPTEWPPVAALIDNLWKDDFDDAMESAYFTVFERHGLAADEIREAVLDLAGQPGGAFAPSVQEIARAVHRRRRIGTLEWVQEMCAAAYAETVRGDDELAMAWLQDRAPAEYLAWLQARDPVWGPRLVSFVHDVGPRTACSPTDWESRRGLIKRAWAKAGLDSIDGGAEPPSALGA